ncbi:MAG: SDR family NAD(P)-dependent oxidoreductase [Pseudomonadota bacterium]|nr:SDR family NAD(P)-dependent oxidoreductase [Pseudomonadota bacterium]
MQIEGSTILVTGANRGLGAAFVGALLARGARKIYAGMRIPASVVGHDDRVVVMKLDVTRPESIEAAADRCRDINILISNAGVTCMHPVLATKDETCFEETLAVNFWGPLRLSRALAPILSGKGSAAGILYILSMASFLPALGAEIYSSSKAAAGMMALGVREELKSSGITVSLAYPGFIETSMSDAFPVPKAPTSLVAERCLDGFLADETSIFPDVFADMTRECLHTRMAEILNEPSATLTRLVGAYVERMTGTNRQAAF